ncbi:MAG TPA: D-aminoacyl-tRNA deacylase [Bryobacteraceae bacterium]|nr:D-aminoacyl-tRNA deacylase [Bryobacteraceae bacterium]
MRLVLQRVAEARVNVRECTVGSIQSGLLVLLGISKNDTPADADYLLKKVLEVRIFPDDAGKMNRNLQEAGGAILIVSQFTLLANCHRGRRPSFDQAAPLEQALALYNYFVSAARRSGLPVETGVFQASMQVFLVNDGPVTLVIDSPGDNRPPRNP